jgi:hypothetical protein
MGHGALGTISRLSPASIPDRAMAVVIGPMSGQLRSLRGYAWQIIRRRCSSAPIDDRRIAEPRGHGVLLGDPR